MAELGIVRQHPNGSIRVLRSTLDETRLSELALSYATRQESDRDKLDTLVSYPQTALYRWQWIPDSLGDTDELSNCGACDNCRKLATREAQRMSSTVRLHPH